MRKILHAWCVMFAATLSAGCELEPNVWTLDVDSGEHGRLIGCALEAWCVASEGRLCGTVGEGSSSIADIDDLADGAYLGLHTGRPDGSSRIAIVRTLDEDSYYTTVVHELGHHYGCHHVEGGAMQAHADRIWRACDVTAVTPDALECAR